MDVGELIVTDDVAARAAAWIAGAVTNILSEHERVSFALSGGTTPAAVYRALADEAGVDWSRVDVYFVDERCVPRDDPDSTARLVLHALIDRLSGPPPAVHRIEGEDADPGAAARRYEERLPDPLDVVVLGIGPDGHVGSLFPNDAAAREAERRVVAVSDAPKPPPLRISLAPRTLREARRTLVLARGAELAWALRAVLEGPDDPHGLPAQIVRRGTWIVDPAAAAELSRG